MHIIGGSGGYVILKSLHVLAAVTWVGGAVTINILATRLRKSSEPATMAHFAKEVEWVGTRVFMPSTLVLLGLGIWMVATSAWSFGDLWVEIGIVGIVITAITGSAILGPTTKKLGTMIEERGPADSGVQALMDRLFKISRVDIAVLVLVVVDMVVKPVR